ncbi:unnamed protein product [Strongylus vulgaris]|uniref:C-type lectin domain-containing protein n=1 Tax=Strongylus vulgaris TaxID=40348 RepID=A0A3P7LP65_STRVU|nr:unnamed protein product [Strongylus vulgaris]
MSRLRDSAEYVSKANHRWAGHIMRWTDDRWTLRTQQWIPRERHRPTSIPTSWMTLAEDRNGWKQCGGLHDK